VPCNSDSHCVVLPVANPKFLQFRFHGGRMEQWALVNHHGPLFILFI